jgi:hypothetical protein
MMSGPGVGELFASNESLQDAPAVRLFAAKNLAAYVTLMENATVRRSRHALPAPQPRIRRRQGERQHTDQPDQHPQL